MSEKQTKADMINGFMDTIDEAKARGATGDLSVVAYGIVTELVKTRECLKECVAALEESQSMLSDGLLENAPILAKNKAALAKAREVSQ